MKEITMELQKRDVVVCGSCGCVFEGAETLEEPCPKCEVEGRLRWVTNGGFWLQSFEGAK